MRVGWFCRWRLRSFLRNYGAKTMVIACTLLVLTKLFNTGSPTASRELGGLGRLGSLDFSADTNPGRQRLDGDQMRAFEVWLSTLSNRTFNYGPFRMREPLFIDQQDRKLFYLNSVNAKLIQHVQNDSWGTIELVRDALVHGKQDCGMTTEAVTFKNVTIASNRRSIRETHPVICPLLVPQSNSFQHFVDGVLPKIAQAYHVLTHPAIKILLFRPRDPIIEEMLETMNLSKQITFYDSGYHRANILLSTCKTPPTHPLLWQKARTLLGSDKTVHSPDSGYVVLLTRRWGRNPGRKITNKQELQYFLRKRYKTEFLLFEGKYNLSETRWIFAKTRVMIGVHGGAFYNMIFAPEGTHIIEIMPTNNTGSAIPPYLAHTIFLQMASNTNMVHWRISKNPHDYLGNVSVNVTKIAKILDIIDGKSKFLMNKHY